MLTGGGVEFDGTSFVSVLIHHLMVAFVTLIAELHLPLAGSAFLTLDSGRTFPTSLAFVEF